MRRWFPEPGEEPLDQVYADLGDRARWCVLGMVASADGRITVDGTSRALGGDADLAAFRALRAAADVVLVGAGTARTERYGPPRIAADRQEERRQRGQAPRPQVALVSRSLRLEGTERLLEEDDAFRPMVLTCAASPGDRRDELTARGAEVVVVGDDDVDLPAALAALGERGLTRVLAEGGPGLAAGLVAGGLVDEVFLTVAPLLVGGAGPGIVGSALPRLVDLELLEGREHEGELLLRYAVAGDRQR